MYGRITLKSLRVVLTLSVIQITIATSTIAAASTFTGINKTNPQCKPAGDFFLPDMPIIKSLKGDAAYSTDINEWEHQMWKTANAAANSATACLQDGLRKQNCKDSLAAINIWASENALQMPKYSASSAEWFSSSYISLHVLIAMLENYAVADSRLKLPTEDKELARKWFRSVLLKADKRRKDILNNHRTVWVIAASKYAAVFDDDEFAEEAKIELDRYFASITEEGIMPYEAIRGSRALFYTFRQASFLMALMDLAYNFDIDAYALYEDTLHRAVAFGLDTMDDNMLIYPYAKRKKAAPNASAKVQDYGKSFGETRGTFQFASVYVRKFPHHPNTKRIVTSDIIAPFLEEDRRHITGHGWDLDCLTRPVRATLEKIALDPATCRDRVSLGLKDGREVALTSCVTKREIVTEQINKNSETWRIASDLSVKNPSYGFAFTRRGSDQQIGLSMFTKSEQQVSGIVEIDDDWCQFSFDRSSSDAVKLRCASGKTFEVMPQLLDKPLAQTSSDAPANQCKFMLTRKAKPKSQKHILTSGTINIDSYGQVRFTETDGFKLKIKKGQHKDLLPKTGKLLFSTTNLEGVFSTFEGKDFETPVTVSLNQARPNADKFDGKYRFDFENGALGELVIYVCKPL